MTKAEQDLEAECLRRGGTVTRGNVANLLPMDSDPAHPPGMSLLPEKPKCRRPTERKARAKQTALAVQLFQSICEREGLPVPQPEVQFCPGRKWRVDWLFEWPQHYGRDQYIVPDTRLALEIEGGSFSEDGGRHNRGASFVAEMQGKYRELCLQGIWLLRVTPGEFSSGAAIGVVKAFAEKRGLAL